MGKTRKRRGGTTNACSEASVKHGRRIKLGLQTAEAWKALQTSPCVCVHVVLSTFEGVISPSLQDQRLYPSPKENAKTGDTDEIKSVSQRFYRSEETYLWCFLLKTRSKEAAHQQKWVGYRGLYRWDITTVIGNETAGGIHAVTAFLAKKTLQHKSQWNTVGLMLIHRTLCMSKAPLLL